MPINRAALPLTILLTTLLTTPAAPRAQAPPAPASAEFQEMVETERAFARLAQEKSVRVAFLEYFVDGMRDFDGADVKERIRSRPDPPTSVEFWWEPRYGDVAASGELGWLTGPVRRRAPIVNRGEPVYGNYASIWKRQPDGRFKVIIDVGIDTPDNPPFPPGVTRVPATSRYTGPQRGDEARSGLVEADEQLTAAIGSAGLAPAYEKAIAPFARLHRTNQMPLVGAGAIVAGLKAQPAWSQGKTEFAEVAQSGDLGYSWGSYAAPASGAAAAESGHYVRVWSRDASSRWHLVLDVLQPRQPAKPGAAP